MRYSAFALILGVAMTAAAFAQVASAPAAEWPATPTAPAGAPNIVLILLDDTGFGASSTFGGPAETPALDRLAAGGLKYNRFHVMPICSPTRAALLSGRNSHRVGFGVVANIARPFPGYHCVWPKSCGSLPEILRRNGYSTAAFGKWHNTPLWEISPTGPFDRWPTGLGFEYFYGFLDGSASQYEPLLYRNTLPVEPSKTPAQGYHFTNDIVNEAISWLQTQQSTAPAKPYFLYLAPGATHSPHQVPAEWIAKYRGKFDQGWDRLREETFARQKQLGVIPDNAELTPRPDVYPAWSSLSADQRRFHARQAEVFAAFLAHTDYEIGRLLEAIRQSPDADNTLVLYIVGDNGGSHNGGLVGRSDSGPQPASFSEQLKIIEELGSPAIMNEYSTVWGWATNTPFQWTKGQGSHLGGIRDPLVISWPARIKEHGAVRDQFTHVNDIAPTLFDLIGIVPPTELDGVKQLPFDGVSFAASLTNAKAPSLHTTQYFEAFGSRSIYHDGWMASALHSRPPGARAGGAIDRDYDKDRWELYHLDLDYSQARDLAAQQPAKLAELRALFEREAEANHVYPLGGGSEFETSNLEPPDPLAGSNEFVYYASTPRLPEAAVPSLADSHRIVATVIIPDAGAEGVLIAHGGRYGGYTLFIKDGRLTYENNFYNRSHDVIVSAVAVPKGKVELVYEYTCEDTGSSNGGTGRFFINGQPAGEGKITRLGPPSSEGSFGIGRQYSSPVSAAYEAPFTFTGTLEKVVIQLQSKR